MSAALHPACDRAIAQAAAAGSAQASAGASPPHPRWVVATTVLASSLAFIDGSVVNVGLPAIGASLGADGAGLTWVVNGYLLPLSALLLIGGAAGDRYGRRRVLVIGIVLFAAASLLCAAAPGLGWLLAGRALLGVGAALLMPNSLAILGASFSGPARGRAIGIWAAAGAGAGAIGPLLGGWLIDVVGWRAIFMINLPIAAAALVLAVVAIRAEKEASPPALDLAGAALASAGLGALTWGLTVASAASAGLADRGARDLGCAVALGTGTLLVLFFLGVERRRGDDAMLPLALFSSRSFVGLNLLTFLLYGALGALLVLVPYVLIQAQGYSATAAGAALLPLALVIAVASPTLGRIAATVGARGRVAHRRRGDLLDQYVSGAAGRGTWHGRRGRTADHRGARGSRGAPQRGGGRLQQRGCPHRWPDRNRAAGLDPGDARRRARGVVPAGCAGWRWCVAGGGGMRVRVAEAKMNSRGRVDI